MNLKVMKLKLMKLKVMKMNNVNSFFKLYNTIIYSEYNFVC